MGSTTPPQSHKQARTNAPTTTPLAYVSPPMCFHQRPRFSNSVDGCIALSLHYGCCSVLVPLESLGVMLRPIMLFASTSNRDCKRRRYVCCARSTRRLAAPSSSEVITQIPLLQTCPMDLLRNATVLFFVFPTTNNRFGYQTELLLLCCWIGALLVRSSPTEFG